MEEAKPGRTMGPVDYLMVRFPGNKFSGKIVPELTDLEKRGIVRVIDLVFITRDANGQLFVSEAKDLKGDAARAYEQIANNIQEWFSQDDVTTIASTLPNNSSAALLLYENVWAIKFKEALLEADAELIDMGRIPGEAIEKAQKLMAKGGA
jgi:uncharacterized membrane protein